MMLAQLFDPGLDLFPLTAAVLAVVTCGLLGNFLLLRRQSLMGDAISHSVLPGLVVAFLVTSSRNPMLMFAGAAVAGVLTVVLIELVKKLGRVEPGAAMGVVFSVMFALGVLLIERAAARHVDLDADCVLYGQLETLAWFEAPMTIAGLWSWATIEAIPRQVWMLLVMCTLAFAFVAMLFKELRIAAFDPGLATSQGIHAGAMHYVLMVFVAAATVASFEAVGSILVIAMLIAPAATARLLTDRLWTQVVASVLIAVSAAVMGYFGATAVPALFDAPSVNAAGSITVVAGMVVGAAAIASPSHGLLIRAWRRNRLGRTAAIDDLLTTLLRFDESGQHAGSFDDLLAVGLQQPSRVAQWATRRGLIQSAAEPVTLTDDGRRRALVVLRNHRLWESYLVQDAGLAEDHVHEPAHRFEHLSVEPPGDADIDPHGRPIPRV
ncbi:MAG: metal ABC transporter permease [Planctomycetota bacterium]